MKSILHFILPALFLLLVSPSTAQQRISTPKPNVLVIIADDQGWGDLGFNGNKTASTPHLDQLAKSGVVLV
jgi:arylsulfatase A-like enzyme